MAVSGQVIAQSRQPRQRDGSFSWAKKYPRTVISFDIEMICWGHACTHNSHPLQWFLSIRIPGMLFLSWGPASRCAAAAFPRFQQQTVQAEHRNIYVK